MSVKKAHIKIEIIPGEKNGKQGFDLICDAFGSTQDMLFMLNELYDKSPQLKEIIKDSLDIHDKVQSIVKDN